ncbi:nitronate monooxygenase [uncultured Vibrio sp.]|uniref:NAD(P)H-dependent flavin oxidoreductase n=1 Tax=uncultured Vibrio sp. TaxID=114054 RepID=UPI000910D81F|nr:nitronate monooxygenase [uncultured Vibrio sp.]OIQ26518.1 MAG: 2-nitropropane dioxygenase [Vibrio sp. MedPE-SWchi]
MRNQNYKELLGTELPIIQAPMAGVQGSDLAIAVSEAGGLGSLPCGMLNVEQIVNEVASIKLATNKPYNLNFFCHEVSPYDEKRQMVWQQMLKPYFDELEIELDSSSKQANRVPFNHKIADAIESFAPPLISFHFGLPEKALLKRVKTWGTKVLSTATTVEEAIWLEANGADGIIAQGLEAGGHRGMFLSSDITTQMGLSSLVPQIVRTVNVPVIAAGGIARSEEAQAARVLGAAAVQVGTAYLLCPESTTSSLHRKAIQSGSASHTALTNVFSGKPARGIVNRVMKDLGHLNPQAPHFPHASIEVTQLRGEAERRLISDFSPLWCGQNTLGCQEISAQALTRQLAEGIE